MIEQHLTILIVVLPLLAAPIVVLLNNKFLSWLVTLLVTATCLVMASVLLADVMQGNTIHYELGGWSPPWGIEYKLDALNGLLVFVVSLIAFVTTIYARKSVSQEIDKHIIPLFYSAYLLCFLGLLGIALTGDIFNVFVFLEVSSLASYALIALGRKRKAISAAFHYLILGTVGATFFLIGVGFLYAATGTLNMAELSVKLASTEPSQMIDTAFAFIVVGIALKAAIYPLHLWLPNAYSYAPSIVAIFLSATATKVAIYVLIRCLFGVFDIQYVLSTWLPQLLIIFGCTAVVYGSLRAIAQQGMRKMLAYSSVAQIGYMIIGIGLFSHSGITATLLHVFNHALMKSALFMAAGLFIYRVNTATLENIKGLGKEMPWTFAAMVIAALSLIGVPGTVGFVSKWQLLNAAIESEYWIIVSVILFGSLLAIIYVWKLIEVLFFQSAEKLRVKGVETGSERIAQSPLGMTVATWFMALCCLYFGINTSISMETAQTAADLLFNMGGSK